MSQIDLCAGCLFDVGLASNAHVLISNHGKYSFELSSLPRLFDFRIPPNSARLCSEFSGDIALWKESLERIRSEGGTHLEFRINQSISHPFDWLMYRGTQLCVSHALWAHAKQPPPNRIYW